MSRPRLVVTVALVAAAAGCRVKTPPSPASIQQEGMPGVVVPGTWTAGGGLPAAKLVQDNWLATFGDDQLSAAVAEAIAHNADLRVAATRVEQAGTVPCQEPAGNLGARERIDLLTNLVVKCLAPGGELSMIVWRRREDNPWVHEAELRVREIVPIVAHDETDQVHCGPGPFSMSGADTVSDMLRSAGYEHITFARYDTDICIGRTLDDAVEFALALGPAGEIIRLAAETGELLKRQVVAALRDSLSAYQRSDGIWAGSSTWFVTARNPGH